MCKPIISQVSAPYQPSSPPGVLRVSGIVNDSITDGPGLRLAIFLQGCPRRCSGCHNPAALDMEGGSLYTAEELFAMVRQNPLLSGVTFSGGEPFLQAEALLPLARRIREAGLSLAIYTGYTLEELLTGEIPYAKDLLELADTLVDGPYIQERRNLSLPFRGSDNQRILHARRSLEAGKPVPEDNPLWSP